MTDEGSTPRRDYFDREPDDDEPPAPRNNRARAQHPRESSGRAHDATALTSGLQRPDAPVQHDRRVLRFVSFFTESREGRDAFVAALRRGGRYEDIIVRSLRERHVPPALIAAALVESGFWPSAVSPVGATGLWQFMPATARAYGLRVERGIDERRSVWRSSGAAAEHLADLYEHFQSWELALAAYNLGFKGVTSRLESYRVNDFWELADIEGALPAETAQYVPRVLAAALVLANLDAFGFDTVERLPPIDGAEIEVPAGIPLEVIARAAHMPVRKLHELNLEILGEETPTSGLERTVLHIPARLADRTRAAIAQLERIDRPDRPERPDIAWDDDLEDRRAPACSAWSGRSRRGDRRPMRSSRPAPYAVSEGTEGRGRGADHYRDDELAGDTLDAQDRPRARGRYDDVYEPPPSHARARYEPRHDAPYQAQAPRPRSRDRLDSARAQTERTIVYYRAVDGDSPQSIGKTFSLTPEEVCAQNGIVPCESIDLGTLLRLRVTPSTEARLKPPNGTEG
jgi:membrane-bound lytic murein transglycosylase D